MNNPKNGSGASPDTFSALTRLDSNVISPKQLSFITTPSGKKSKPVQYSYQKVVVTNTLVEVYEYEKPVLLDRKPPDGNGESLRADEYRKRTAHKAVNEIKRLVKGNFFGSGKFLTLTFNEQNNFDINNISVCNKKFSEFIDKMKKKYPKFKYVAVLELQKKGAVHYHILNNLPYIPKNEIAETWEYGFVDIRLIDNVQHAAGYLTKYMTKANYHEKFKGKRTYFTSKNLKRSRTYYGQSATYILTQLIVNDFKPNFSNIYKSFYQGQVVYKEFNLNPDDGSAIRSGLSVSTLDCP